MPLLKPLALFISSLYCVSLFAADAPPAAPAETKAEAGADAKPAGPVLPGALKPFADVIKEAKQQDGLFPIWKKDDKVWLEVPATAFEQPFFFGIGRTHGLGERGVYGGQMERSYVASFRRLGDRVQLIAHNLVFTAPQNTPQAIAVREGFSDSLLGATTVVSQPHPQRKSVLVDANALLLADIPGGAFLLESAFRMAYAFDAKQSVITATRADAQISALQVSAHFAIPKLPQPPATPTPNPPVMPKNLQDARSLFLGYHYSLAALPAPMTPRVADDRLGHFVTTRWDYGNDMTPTPRVHYVSRWRLEKSDPAAAISEAKEPVVYWLDKNIPLKYRDAIRDGVLEWNKAFEKIGIRNALVVKQQADNDEFHTAEARRASIRWFVGSDVGFAIGPSRKDPRTGEILDADIALSDVFSRGSRLEVTEQLPPPGHAHEYCNLTAYAINETEFALDMLAARGDIDPDSPAAEEFVRSKLRDVTMHEVGHTLGLRHNFRSSSIYTPTQLQNKTFTTQNGLAGSVMDYSPTNIALKGEGQGSYHMDTLGPYDYWAIEYAYKPIASAEEKMELTRIAARSTEPQLAFATDEDAGDNGRDDGFDPSVNRFDLSSDPLAYYEKRINLSRELWTKWQKKELPAGESYAVLRRNVERGLAQIGRVAVLVPKYIGGMTHLRDHAGTGRVPLTPVAAQEQRRALKLLAGQLLAVDSFKLPAAFLRKLTPDNVDRSDAGQAVDLGLSSRIQALQKSLVERLYSDQITSRLLESGDKAEGVAPLTLPELYDTLLATVWQEAQRGVGTDGIRRNLQREHLKLMVKQLTASSTSNLADARALTRENALRLRGWLHVASGKSGLNRETRAHYADALATLDDALKATFTRAGA